MGFKAPGDSSICRTWSIELIPTCLCFANLQYVDRFGEFPGSPGTAAELGEDLPYLELRVCAFTRCAELRVGPVGVFLRFRLFLALVRDLRPAAALVSLVGEGGQALFLQLVEDAPDPLGLLVGARAGKRTGHPEDVPVRRGD